MIAQNSLAYSLIYFVGCCTDDNDTGGEDLCDCLFHDQNNDTYLDVLQKVILILYSELTI